MSSLWSQRTHTFLVLIVTLTVSSCDLPKKLSIPCGRARSTYARSSWAQFVAWRYSSLREGSLHWTSSLLMGYWLGCCTLVVPSALQLQPFLSKCSTSLQSILCTVRWTRILSCRVGGGQILYWPFRLKMRELQRIHLVAKCQQCLSNIRRKLHCNSASRVCHHLWEVEIWCSFLHIYFLFTLICICCLLQPVLVRWLNLPRSKLAW